jgi:hypothetical protein
MTLPTPVYDHYGNPDLNFIASCDPFVTLTLISFAMVYATKYRIFILAVFL